MGRGNPDIKKYSPIVDNTEIDVKENAVLVQYALDIFNTPDPDLNNPDDVKRCIDSYFNNCVSKGLRPGNLGLYGSLGLDKKQVNDLINGRISRVNGKDVNVKTVELIKKACKGIRGFRELLGSQGKLNPATLIFWQKNFDGLEDVQRMELAADMPKPSQSPDEIAAEIEQDIPVDVTCSVTDADT